LAAFGLLALLAVITGTLLALLQARPDYATPLVERVLSNILDRRFSIVQLQRLELGADAYLEASGLALANPDWAGDAPMAELDALGLRIHLPSLWRDGPVVIRELRAQGLRLDLQRTPEGEANWHFPGAGADEPEDSEGLLLPVVLEQVDLRDTTLRFRDPDQDESARLDQLRLELRAGDRLSVVNANGLVNDQPLALRGTFGPETALLTGRNFKLDLELTLGKLRVVARGNIDDLTDLQGADLALEVAAPRSRPLLDLLGLDEVRDGPLDFSGRVSRADAGLRIEVQGALAEFGLEVDGYVEQPLQADGIDLELGLRGPSMAEVGAVLGVEGLREWPFELSGHLVKRGSLLVLERGELTAGPGRVTLSARLPEFPSIDGWDADLSATDIDMSVLGKALGRSELPQIMVDIEGRLGSNPAGIELLELSIVGSAMRLELDGTISDAPGYAGTELRGSMSGDDMSQLAPLLGAAHLPPEAFHFNAALASEAGAWSLREATLAAPHFTVELEGEVDRLFGPQQIQGRLHFSTPSLAGLVAAYQLPAPSFGEAPLTLRAQLQKAEQGVEISDVAGTLDAMPFTGSGFISPEADWAGSGIEFKAGGDDLQRDLVRLLPVALPAAPYAIDAALTLHAPLVSIERLEGDIGGNRVHAKLQLIREPDAEPAVRGEARIDGDSLLALLELMDIEPDAEDTAYQLVATIDASASAVSIDPLRLSDEYSELDGAVSMRFSDKPTLDINLHSSALRLDALLPDLTARPGPAEDDAAKEKRDGGLWRPPTRKQLAERTIPDTPLPLEWIKRIEGRLRYSADRIYTRVTDSGRVAIDLEIADGVLTSRRFEWLGPVSQGSASLSIDARDGANRFTFGVDSNRIPLLWMLSGAMPEQESVYRGRLSGSGATLRELMGSLNGAFVVSGRGAKLENRTLDVVMGDLLTTILTRLNPVFEAEPYTTVRCHSAAVRFDDGILKLDPGFAMRTRDVDILASGAVDLDDESLAIRFDTRPRKGIGLSAGSAVTPYLMLAGNLAHPYLTLDPEGTVISGGAAVATGGMSVVAGGLWRRLQASMENPCEQVIKNARKNKKQVYSGLLPDKD
jgi:uncharacterized protein involved in outer membrane biogenesis